MKVALVYDRVNKWGGAERILLALRSIFPEAPLYTSVYNKTATSWAQNFNVFPSFLQKFGFAKSSSELFALAMPVAFESFSFDEYDTVISVTSEAAKGIITKSCTKHICICLTPTRYLWSGYDEYFKSKPLKFLSSPVVRYLRLWDRMAAQRPDHYIAISKTVQDRIKRYYGRDSTVIYPPVGFKRQNTEHKKQGEKKYFLMVSRVSKFVPYKRLDIAIEAANKRALPLKIVGEGNAIEHFKRRSGKTIEFLGRLTDKELSYYYKQCAALIFPGVEDFGLAMVEAQLHGRPVIAFRGGGATEIVQEGKTGEFFDSQDWKSLARIMENFDIKRYNEQSCIQNAERFSFKYFKKSLMGFIEKS